MVMPIKSSHRSWICSPMHAYSCYSNNWCTSTAGYIPHPTPSPASGWLHCRKCNREYWARMMTIWSRYKVMNRKCKQYHSAANPGKTIGRVAHSPVLPHSVCVVCNVTSHSWLSLHNLRTWTDPGGGAMVSIEPLVHFMRSTFVSHTAYY